MTNENELFQAMTAMLDAWNERRQFPFGPAIKPEHMDVAGQACVRLCEGDADKGRTLWKLVADQCGGYMPAAAAIALIRASATLNLVPDVTAPEPS